MNRRSLIVLLLVVMGGFLTRLVYVSWPPQVVFDEVHFGKFVSAYCCTGERFFDIHPPHAKLLLAGVVSLTEYDGSFPFEYIGQPYEAVPIVWLRLVPALAGVALAVAVFFLLRIVGVSEIMAGLGAAAVIFDNAFILQSRVVSLDMVLLVSIVSAVVCVLAARRVAGWRAVLWAGAAGAAAGVAVGSKFTGLVAPALLGLLLLGDGITQWRWVAWRRLFVWGAAVAVGFGVVYVSGWALHFWVLSEPGSGDVWRVPTWDGPVIESFIRETVAFHQLMLEANYSLSATHPDASPWWSWPLMARPVFYWQGEGRAMHLLGNPIVWWGSTLVMAVAVLNMVWRALQGKWRHDGTLWLLVAGYAIALAPLVGVPRVLFMYHYFTPLVFALLVSVVWLQRTWRGNERRYVPWVILMLLVGWLAVSPVTYGLPTPQLWEQILAALPRF